MKELDLYQCSIGLMEEIDGIPCIDEDTEHECGDYGGREQNDNIITTRYRCEHCDKIIEDVYVEEKVGQRIIDEKKKEYSEDFG